MKKTLSLGIIGAGVGIVLFLGSYYGMGIATERVLKKNIEALSQSNGIALELQNYHRGWFQSQAILKWTMKTAQSVTPPLGHHTVMLPRKEYLFDIPLNIYHGPAIVTGSKFRFGLGYAKAQIALPNAFVQELSAEYVVPTNKLLATMEVMVSYLNKINTKFLVPNYALHAKNGVDYLQWQKLKSNITVALNKQQVQGVLSLHGFAWSKQDMEGILSSARTTYDMQQGLYGLYVGTAKLDLPSLLVTQKLKDQPAQSVLRLVGAHLRTASSIQNALFDTSISLKIKELGLPGKEYLNNVLNVSFKNLDANTLASMNRKLAELQRPGHTNQPVTWVLIADLPALLSKGAQLTVDNFEITTHEGDVKAKVYLNLPKEAMNNPFQLLQKINGESHFRVSKVILNNWLQTMIKRSLLQKEAKQIASTSEGNQPILPRDINAETSARTNEKIKEWVDAGVLVQEEQDYLILMTLTNGKLLINGHPFSPALLTI